MISTNILLNKLRKTEFHHFLQLYAQKYFLTESILKKFYFDDSYKKNDEKHQTIYVSLDETTDAKGRYIVNVIIATLEGDSASEIPLL